MPRYFFHVIDGTSLRDETGTELPDIYTAQAQAIRLSAEIPREMGAKFWNGTEWKLEVADEHVSRCLKQNVTGLGLLPHLKCYP